MLGPRAQATEVAVHELRRDDRAIGGDLQQRSVEDR
jgi:hypothetical protein